MDVASSAGHKDVVELLRASGGEFGVKDNAEKQGTQMPEAMKDETK
jgi:hypothetical protein